MPGPGSEASIDSEACSLVPAIYAAYSLDDSEHSFE